MGGPAGWGLGKTSVVAKPGTTPKIKAVIQKDHLVHFFYMQKRNLDFYLVQLEGPKNITGTRLSTRHLRYNMGCQNLLLFQSKRWCSYTIYHPFVLFLIDIALKLIDCGSKLHARCHMGCQNVILFESSLLAVVFVYNLPSVHTFSDWFSLKIDR